MSTAEQLRCQLVGAVYETQYHLVASELQLDIKAELKKTKKTLNSLSQFGMTVAENEAIDLMVSG